MKILIILAVLCVGVAFTQYDGDEDGDNIRVQVQWPQNEHALGGGIASFIFENLENGSCVLQLPAMVNLFHVMNGHIVPGEESNPVEGRYKIAAPAHWEAINGTFNILILFDRDEIFNLTDIEFRCDTSDVAEISVYSFPQNNLMQEASSNIFYRPGYHVGDVLTINLPSPVARFNFTTMDSAYTVTSSGMKTFTLSGFKNPEGIDAMKEVHFSLNYGDEWFSAGDITVKIDRNEE